MSHSKAPYNICSPKSHNKLVEHISPVDYDIYSEFSIDEFQLKKESAQKNLKLIEYPEQNPLFSKSSSSKKRIYKSITNSNEFEEEEGIKRRLFGSKPLHNDSNEKSPQNENNSVYYNTPSPYQPQYVSQVRYKSNKYKHASFLYLIPFCNKCNLPLILPIHPDFDIEMVQPGPMPHHSTPMASVMEREQTTPMIPSPTPISKPKTKHKIKKKPPTDENGKKIIRRRKRKTYEQLQTLIREFQANPEWSKDNMQEVSEKTGLSEAQVYKWGWDQKRKMNDPNHDIHDELRMYKKHEEEEEVAEKSIIRKLNLPSSSKKRSKLSSEKFIIKTGGIPSCNKEKLNFENQKHETKGVKRKLKALHVQNRDLSV